jgi:pantothenate kinase, type III
MWETSLFSIFHFPFSIMLLAVDIGNSSIKFGVFDRDKLVSKLSIPTNKNSTSEDFDRTVAENLSQNISAVIVASVVPEIEKPLNEFATRRYGTPPIFVDGSFDFGLKIRYEPASALGIDRIITASAAAIKYGVPCIVCSFGTATTVDVVNADREYLGGIIAPGMNTMAEALHLKTSKLPKVEIARPKSVIGNTTVGSIQSGIFYGYIGLADGIISRMTAELDLNPRIVATGGFATLIAKEISAIRDIDESLLLEGLQIIYEMRHAQKRTGI